VTVQNGQKPTGADHARHDRLLVSRFAMDDAYPGERDEALKLTESCADCATLAADIRLLSASMKQLPSPRRDRDFSITPEQAERLRGSSLTRWLRAFTGPAWTTVRPLAGVALSIGLVMAVIGSVVPNYAPASGDALSVESAAPSSLLRAAPQAAPPQPAASAGAGRAEDMPAASAAASAGAEGYAPAAAAPSSAPDYRGVQNLSEASPEPMTDNFDQAYVAPSPVSVAAAPPDDAAAPPNDANLSVQADPSRNLLTYAGLAIAAFSLALLSLAWFARRHFADPLLR
jgi:hypothetical protein